MKKSEVAKVHTADKHVLKIDVLIYKKEND